MSMLRASRLSFVLLLLFVLSGIAGLIYQSIWSHYLGLVLGHAAYAQTLVLAIFMGGMALGAWLASRWSQRWRHLILAYALIELAIGVMGLVFHGLFVAYTDVSQQTVLPMFSSATMAHVYQWLTASILILPQCILLGATFPLLSAGLLRAQEEGVGEVLGGLYFSNSIGAAIGALLTTFLILPLVGMPGTILTAGALNIVVAAIAWGVWKTRGRDPVQARVATPQATTADESFPRLSKILLVSAFVTGATSFVYEIGWVRLLNQALGTTIHSFELMLAAFILGLAFGGLWVRKRSPRIRDVIAYAGGAQILMGVSALLSIVAFSQSFQWVGWMMQALARTDGGYTLFNLGGAVVSLLVMFPAAFFAGMTLPLFTLALLNKGGGEQVIGRVYAANTLGAIVGVLLMMHVLTPVIGVRLSVMLAAIADAALGLYLIRAVSPARRTVGYVLGGAATAVALLVVTYGGRIDPLEQVSGVFRNGSTAAPAGMTVPYLRDGKTATVSVSAHSSGAALIATNGKPDASLMMDPRESPTPDEITMVMAGALPYIHHPNPRNIAVIGWGSGLTTHTLAGSPRVQSIETVEIEPAMYEGARLFHPRVSRAYDDPRSHVRFDDARTYFSTGNRHYDVIVSEPSNPWVSGVASLFTQEFYGFIRRHLQDDGILVQWLYTYELNDQLLSTMVAALIGEFPNTEVYVTNTNDLIFVAHKGKAAKPDWSAIRQEPLASELKRVGLASETDFAIRRVGGPRVLQAFVRNQGATPYSDFYPTVALNAPRSRFKRELADTLVGLVDNGMPVLDILDGRQVHVPLHALDADTSRFSTGIRTAAAMRHALIGRDASQLAEVPELASRVGALQEASARVITPEQVTYWSDLASRLADSSLGLLPPAEQEGLWIHPAWIDVPKQPELVQALLQVYAAAASRDVAAMNRDAVALLRRSDVSQLSPHAREHVLVIAQLGAIGTGSQTQVSANERDFGRDLQPSAALGPVRSYLLAWADEPAKNAAAGGR
ncbi:spermine synthase [Lysobacter sp. LF1]|uniref:Spermine synthase n=1 Tax=Lysobacter stagni TaxID=3045172 RepID=A0ABT6XFA3_9GAMM|nr:spermine synthase [Lysobacter sp. LF1]MDI9238837.1 spermine synthase [Lysobacter sp. LF1]